MFRFLEVADYTSAQSPITLIISSLFKAHPSRFACLLHIKTHLQRVAMTYMAQPTHFSLMQLSYEHASKCLSSLLLMWIYLFLWQRRGGGGLTQLFTVTPLLPPDDEDKDDDQRSLPKQTARTAGFMGEPCPSSTQNALSARGSFSLSLLYRSRSSQVHNFRVLGASLDRAEI